MQHATWNLADFDEPENDLCGRHEGVYLDVVRHVNGTWSAMYNMKRLAEGLSTREAGIDVIETFLQRKIDENAVKAYSVD